MASGKSTLSSSRNRSHSPRADAAARLRAAPGYRFSWRMTGQPRGANSASICLQHGPRRGALAAVVHQDRLDCRVVLGEDTLDRHPHQCRTLVVHDADGDQRRLGRRGPGARGEPFGRRGKGYRLCVPARPAVDGEVEIPAGSYRAQRRRGQRRDAVAEGDVVRRDQRAVAVRRRDQLRCSPGRRGQERNTGVQALGDRERGVLLQRREHREPSRLRQVGDRPGGIQLGDGCEPRSASRGRSAG